MTTGREGIRDESDWCPEHARHTERVPLHPANRRPVGRFARFRGLGGFCVYVLRAHGGGVLYVGMTSNIDQRMAWRTTSDPWFRDVCHWQTTAEGFSDAASASRRERELIELHQPPHNRAGIVSPYVPHGGTGEGHARAGKATQARMKAMWAARREM